MTLSIVQVRSKLKTILNYRDPSDQKLTMMKTRKKNNLIDHTDTIYVENETKISWLIGLCSICDKNQRWQWYDWSY